MLVISVTSRKIMRKCVNPKWVKKKKRVLKKEIYIKEKTVYAFIHILKKAEKTNKFCCKGSQKKCIFYIQETFHLLCCDCLQGSCYLHSAIL